MRALVLRDGELLVDSVLEPSPGPGQILVEPLATGICGSDLSAWQHTKEFLQASIDSDTDMFIFDPAKDLVMGHEFSARVVESGPGVTGYRSGEAIVALPMAVDAAGVAHCVGYATDYPGALSERVVLQAEMSGVRLHPRVPEGFDPYLAALTEPLTVGFNAVDRSRITPEIGAVVIGCGPVGLGAFWSGSWNAASTASWCPTPRRPGDSWRWTTVPHVVVDPTVEDPIEAWRTHRRPGHPAIRLREHRGEGDAEPTALHGPALDADPGERQLHG